MRRCAPPARSSTSCSPPATPRRGTPRWSPPPRARASTCTSPAARSWRRCPRRSPRRACVAVCALRRRARSPRSLAAAHRLVAVLAHVRDPGNAGTVLRTADAAGADAVVLAGASVDPYNGKCVRASAGSLFHLPLAAGVPMIGTVDRAEGRAGCRCWPPTGTAPSISTRRSTTVGSTARPPGCSATRPGVCRPRLARSPTTSCGCRSTAAAESLNLATAAAVCLYASARAQRTRRLSPRSAAVVSTAWPGVKAGRARRTRAGRSIDADDLARRARRGRRPGPRGGCSTAPRRRSPASTAAAAVGKDLEDALPLDAARRARLVDLHPTLRRLPIAPVTRSATCCSPTTEVLVTARYVRDAPRGPVTRVVVSLRDTARPGPRGAQPRRADLHGRPRAALTADQRQGLHRDPAGQVGPLQRRPEAPDARDRQRRRRPRHPADHRAARHRPHRVGSAHGAPPGGRPRPGGNASRRRHRRGRRGRRQVHRARRRGPARDVARRRQDRPDPRQPAGKRGAPRLGTRHDRCRGVARRHA